MFEKKNAVAVISGLVGEPIWVKVTPEVVLKNRMMYQSWNMALAMTYVIKIICVAIAAYIDPDKLLHGWWIMGAALAGMTCASKLSLDILSAQRRVDALLGEMNPKATKEWISARKETLDKVTAATLVDMTIIGTSVITLALGAWTTKDPYVFMAMPVAAALATVLPMAVLTLYFTNRPAERRLLIGR